jgi:hypothetical protein
LHWAIRKCTLTVLIRNLKSLNAVGASKKEKAKYSEKQSCAQWKEHQNFLFDFAVEKLSDPQIYYCLLTEPSGQIFIKPAVMKLWTIFGDSYVPTIDTDASQIGLGWHTITKEDLSNKKGSSGALPFFPEHVRFIAFEDVIDINFQYVDETSNEWCQKNLSHLHHHSKFQSSSGSGKQSNKKEQEMSNVFMIINIVSKYDYRLQLLACCLQDYNECIIAIQNMLLFLTAKTKQEQAGSGNRDNDGNKIPSVSRGSLGNVSIHQCSAALAANLVLD